MPEIPAAKCLGTLSRSPLLTRGDLAICKGHVMPDTYQSYSSSLTAPLLGAFPITPNDNADLPNDTRQVRVTGSGGALAAIWKDGQTRTTPVQAGDILDWRLVRVLATGTTATGLWGFY
jgi:hypothetical protein